MVAEVPDAWPVPRLRGRGGLNGVHGVEWGRRDSAQHTATPGCSAEQRWPSHARMRTGHMKRFLKRICSAMPHTGDAAPRSCRHRGPEHHGSSQRPVSPDVAYAPERRSGDSGRRSRCRDPLKRVGGGGSTLSARRGRLHGRARSRECRAVRAD